MSSGACLFYFGFGCSQEIPALEEKIRGSKVDSTLFPDAVTPDDVADVISQSTGIPVSKLLMGEKERLLAMESYLDKRVVGTFCKGSLLLSRPFSRALSIYSHPHLLQLTPSSFLSTSFTTCRATSSLARDRQRHPYFPSRSAHFRQTYRLILVLGAHRCWQNRIGQGMCAVCVCVCACERESKRAREQG